MRGLIHHSDQGVQYASKDYIDCLRKHNIKISMSRKGNPYDNAFAESFIKTLKCEEVYLNEYETMVRTVKLDPDIRSQNVRLYWVNIFDTCFQNLIASEISNTCSSMADITSIK